MIAARSRRRCVGAERAASTGGRRRHAPEEPPWPSTLGSSLSLSSARGLQSDLHAIFPSQNAINSPSCGRVLPRARRGPSARWAESRLALAARVPWRGSKTTESLPRQERKRAPKISSRRAAASPRQPAGRERRGGRAASGRPPVARFRPFPFPAALRVAPFFFPLPWPLPAASGRGSFSSASPPVAVGGESASFAPLPFESHRRLSRG